MKETSTSLCIKCHYYCVDPIGTTGLSSQIERLKRENTELNATVEWMHQTIWELLARNKKLEKELAKIDPDSDLLF